jgi:DNA-binding NarL/FixJ family response regulator
MAISKHSSSVASDDHTEPTTGKRRVFVVDDHPIVRQGLAQLIDAEADLVVCGQGEDAIQALSDIRHARPDLVLLDVSIKDGDGLELLKEIKAFDPGIVVLMLSMHDEALYAERALRAGASGYVMKQEAPDILLAAVRKVLSGQVSVSEKMSSTLLQRMVGGKKGTGGLPMDRLTDRELEVFRLIGSGMSVKTIADKLCLSVKTVEAHREHIKDKLNLKSSAELLRFAIQNSPDSR